MGVGKLHQFLFVLRAVLKMCEVGMVTYVLRGNREAGGFVTKGQCTI